MCSSTSNLFLYLAQFRLENAWRARLIITLPINHPTSDFMDTLLLLLLLLRLVSLLTDTELVTS